MQQLFVIKIGGNILDDEASLASFLASFSAIPGKKILVHGGGKIATKIANQLGIQSKYTNGRRITDADTIEVVTMVYGGLINKKIVAQLQALQTNAIGLTGADSNLIPSVKRPILKDGTDFGFVGDVNHQNINTTGWINLLDNGLIPVVAPLTHDGKGQILNTNADTIASSVATALSDKYKVRLIYCFEKKGVLRDVNDERSVITTITKEFYQELKSQNILVEGILPKLESAFQAVEMGVSEVLIGHADDLIQNTTDHTSGTLIK